MSNICSFCNKDKTKVRGCIKRVVENRKNRITALKSYSPIKVGEAEDMTDLLGGKCSECGANMYEYHHVGCSLEICPVCRQHRSSCECVLTDTKL